MRSDRGPWVPNIAGQKRLSLLHRLRRSANRNSSRLLDPLQQFKDPLSLARGLEKAVRFGQPLRYD